MKLILDLWPRIATFCTYHDILNRLFLLNSEIMRKLKSANVELWMSIATSFMHQYLCAKRPTTTWTKVDTVTFLSNYYRRNLHFRIDWAAECRTLYQFKIALRYYCWNGEPGVPGVVYIYRVTEDERNKRIVSLGEIIGNSRRTWYELRTVEKKWTLTSMNLPNENHLPMVLTPGCIIDDQIARKAVLGFTLEVRHWFFETWDGSSDFDPIGCRQCGRIVTPCTISDFTCCL